MNTLRNISVNVPRWGLYWIALALIWCPSLWTARFLSMKTPLLETHPIRQAQTALTARYMATGQTGFPNYQSPLDGKLWNFIREMPVYQWTVSRVVRKGISLDTAARWVSLVFYSIAIPFLFLMIRNLSGSQPAAWASLIFMSLPFTALYSRACFPDTTALALLIMGLWGATQYWRKANHFSVVFATTSLTLSALTKTTVWFGPVLALGLFMILEWQEFKKRKLLNGAIISFSVQVFFLVFWMRYAEKMFSLQGRGSDSEWILGTFAQRLTLSNYIELLKTFFTWVLDYWAAIPFACGLLLWPYQRRHLILVLIAGLAPVLCFFNVTLYHDYYFLNSLVPVLFIAGIGFTEFFSKPALKQMPLLLLLGFIITYRVQKLELFFSGLFSERVSEKLSANTVEHLTVPEDIIFSDKGLDRISLAYLSNRFFLMQPNVSLDALEPTAFQLHTDTATHWLSRLNYDRIFITSKIRDTFLLRVNDQPPFIFDESKHIAIKRHSQEATQAKLTTQLELHGFCKQADKAYRIAVSGPPSTLIEVGFPNTKTYFRLPTGELLSLPTKSAWGCDVTLKLVPADLTDPKFFQFAPSTARIASAQ